MVNIVASIPMFPGSMIHIWLETLFVFYPFYISAVINGITYGLVAWIVYELGSKIIKKSTSKELVGEEKKRTRALLNESEVVVCPNPKCQRKVEEPILLKNLSAVLEEQYYACSYCLMKLDVDAENVQLQKEEKKQGQEKPSVKPPEKEEKELSRCPHHFGYLAEHSKDTSIPQECLICSKAVKCMFKAYQEEEHYAV